MLRSLILGFAVALMSIPLLVLVHTCIEFVFSNVYAFGVYLLISWTIGALYNYQAYERPWSDPETEAPPKFDLGSEY